MTAGTLQRWIIGVTGASGAPYAHRLIHCALEANVQVHLVVTPHGRLLFRDEMGLQQVTPRSLLGREDDRLILYNYHDVGAAIASGSTPMDGMIVCPCSSNSLAQIAAGMGDNLLNRAAQVTLKERRRLILVPREMPMSHIELENCLRLSNAGAIICPAAPGFYMMPASVQDLVDFVAGKVLDLAGIRHELNTRWTDMLTQESAPKSPSP